ncbi:hypothetical protein [Helicobacter sp. MIT 14-3879]|uniref:hypothetical protein n=1 Tax=Helicobacter sp. MIT 14-3879 TaxID=2040649 RepID=UPI000E1E37F4|nr:hypothetical protein [Helicobacter sp. MIT 14-3879]RDU65508.1 hypothetical protein CQA44_00500 [Helicobacter sp. MIT 14-3879]
MRFIEIINEIDWGKNVIFLILYINIIIICVFFYLIPMLDTYRTTVAEYKKMYNLDMQVKNTLGQLNKNNNNTLKENAVIFKNLRSNIKIENIQNYVNKYLSNAKLEDLETKELENNIKINTIKIYGNANSINNIIELINNLTSLDASIRVFFPLVIHKKQNILYLEISIAIYTSTYMLNESPELYQ